MRRGAGFLAGSLLAAIMVVWVAPPAVAGGLRCSVGEVVVENLRIGQTYSLRALANLPLSLTSACDGPVLVEVLPQIPGASELRLGAEAIPSLDWVSASPETLALAPGETKAADLMITLPDDESLFGRKFQAIFWSHTLPQPGELLAVGLKSRVIFTVDTVRSEPEEVAPAGDIGIEFTPDNFKFEGVVPGHSYSIGDGTKQALQVRNTSTRPLTVDLIALTTATAGVPLDKGHVEMLGPATVTLTPAHFTLMPGETQTITGTMSLARDKSLKGKNFMCVVSAAVADLPVKTRIYSRIYASAR